MSSPHARTVNAVLSGIRFRTQGLEARGSCWILISHKLFMNTFGKSQFPHKSVNSSFVIANIKNKLTDWMNKLNNSSSAFSLLMPSPQARTVNAVLSGMFVMIRWTSFVVQGSGVDWAGRPGPLICRPIGHRGTSLIRNSPPRRTLQ